MQLFFLPRLQKRATLGCFFESAMAALALIKKKKERKKVLYFTEKATKDSAMQNHKKILICNEL